jgi:hypothetical protein
MAITLSAMITGGIILIFNSGIDSWIFGQTYTEIQDTANLCQNQIIEGSFIYDGLREILEITKAEQSAITFIPWWEQKIPSIEPKKKIVLEYPINTRAPTPIGEIWSVKKNQYELINIEFYSKGENISDFKSYVSFPENVPNHSKGRVFFYPDSQKNNEKIEMTISWDPQKKILIRSYRGNTTPLARFSEDVLITDFKIEYINGTNEVIPISKLNNLTPMNNPITAVRDFITVTKEHETYTLRSFVNIRKKSIGTSGNILTEGSKISIPSSRKIKTLSLINFIGIKKNSSIYCVISSKNENKTYALKVNLTLKNEIPWITGYDVEYPKGNIVFSQEPNVPASRGINLLTLDYTGVYDYGSEKEIQGQVDFTSDDVQFKLEKSNIGGVSLLQR